MSDGLYQNVRTYRQGSWYDRVFVSKRSAFVGGIAVGVWLMNILYWLLGWVAK